MTFQKLLVDTGNCKIWDSQIHAPTLEDYLNGYCCKKCMDAMNLRQTLHAKTAY